MEKTELRRGIDTAIPRGYLTHIPPTMEHHIVAKKECRRMQRKFGVKAIPIYLWHTSPGFDPIYRGWTIGPRKAGCLHFYDMLKVDPEIYNLGV